MSAMLGGVMKPLRTASASTASARRRTAALSGRYKLRYNFVPVRDENRFTGRGKSHVLAELVLVHFETDGPHTPQGSFWKLLYQTRPGRHQCRAQKERGSVPVMKVSDWPLGQDTRASCPVSGSIRANVTPLGGSKTPVSRPETADFMKRVQIGSAAWEPVSPNGWLSSYPTPDDGEEIRRESYEPGIALIVCGAGLAGCDRFETADTNLSRRALIDDASHHVGYQICACRMHHGVAGGLHGVEGPSLGVPDLDEESRVDADAMVSDDRIGGG